MNVFVIFGQMLVLFAMMMIGYFTYRGKWVNDDTSARLSKLVVNVFNPVLVVNGVLGQNDSADSQKVISNLVLIILYFAILIVLSFIISFLLRLEKKTKSIYQLMTIFSNLGFMGIPVIKSIYGNEAVIYVAFYILAYNLLVYTYGMALTKRAALEKNRQTVISGEVKGTFLLFIKRIINPGVVAALIAITIFATDVKLPAFIGSFCDYVGNATIPLSMILIGVSIAQTDIRKMFGDIRIYLFILLRMVVLPIIVIFLMRNLAIDSVVFGVFIIEFGMPVGSIITLMAKESGADAEYCTKGIVLSTLASIVTIPLVCAFL